MFVLLGRDPHAPILVEFWAAMRELIGEKHDKVQEARDCARHMRIFHSARRAEDALLRNRPDQNREEVVALREFAVAYDEWAEGNISRNELHAARAKVTTALFSTAVTQSRAPSKAGDQFTNRTHSVGRSPREEDVSVDSITEKLTAANQRIEGLIRVIGELLDKGHPPSPVQLRNLKKAIRRKI